MAIIRTWGADMDGTDVSYIMARIETDFCGGTPERRFYALARLPREPIISWAQRYQLLARRASVTLTNDVDAWRRFKVSLNKDDPEWVAILVHGGKGALDEVLDQIISEWDSNARADQGRKRTGSVFVAASSQPRTCPLCEKTGHSREYCFQRCQVCGERKHGKMCPLLAKLLASSKELTAEEMNKVQAAEVSNRVVKNE